MDEKILDKAEAMSHVLRLEVMTVLSRGPASAAEVAQELGVSAAKVRCQLRRLRDSGLIEDAGVRQRRGTLERFYVPFDKELLLTQTEVTDLPEKSRRRLDANLLKVIFREALRALAAGTLSARVDASIVRFPVSVDAQGWAELAQIHAESFERVREVRDRSSLRLRESGEEPVLASSINMVFETPPAAVTTATTLG